ncbi:uncharacterized protein [Solanum tuberosum]|uniref:uncharacterized protein n=1 Tax=Solanum tuberosum TaxID=4113 RepID=UPI0003D25815|nr:PREDICTED: uncharacterized protein LOC102603373 [Solanum tuberosum]
MSEHKKAALFKYKSWSPDIQREEVWLKRKKKHFQHYRRSMSITNDDIDELRACFELGFGFDSNSDLDPKLTKAFPALELYHAVNKLSRSSSSVSTVTSDGETPSSVETSVSIVEPGADQETMKLKLKQWAQVVGLSVLPSPFIYK